MKKAVCALVLIASLYHSGEDAAVEAATYSTAAKTVSVQLTVNSPGADGTQFVLQGLQTPAAPSYTCSKMSAAAGNGTSVHFAVVDLNGVNGVKITVSGTLVGKLAVTNATYVDQSGNTVAGRVAVKLL
jgi:hypothetical protein